MKNRLSTIVISAIVSVIVSLVCWGTFVRITKNSVAINDGYSQFTVYLTLTTLIATLLAIALAVVFGINWLLIDRKLRKAVDISLQKIDTKVHTELEMPLRATTGFLVALMDAHELEPDEMADRIQIQLSIWGSIPNARTYMTNVYLSDGFVIDHRTNLFTPNRENLQSAFQWIQMAEEHPNSEDKRVLHFLNAIRLAILNEPNSCLHELRKVQKFSKTERSIEHLLARPLSKEIFALCGALRDAQLIIQTLGIGITDDMLRHRIERLESGESFFALGRSANAEQIFTIEISSVTTEEHQSYNLQARPNLTRTFTNAGGYGTGGSTPEELIRNYKHGNFVILCYK